MTSSATAPPEQTSRGAALAEIFDSVRVTSAAAMLRLDDVRVQFGGLKALDGVSFEIGTHELGAVIGPNGSGKSTMLNTISGLVREQASGEIFLRDGPILGRPPAAIAGLGVGRSFQTPSLISAESALQNVIVGQHVRLGYSMFDQIFRRRLVRRMESAAEARALVVLDFMGIADVAHRPVGELAYGTQKLIDIARAIAAGPDLLLLDEPTSGLDGDEQTAVGTILRELHRVTNVTILVVEHHMDVVRAIADKVVALESGRVVVTGSPDEVLGSQAFHEAVAIVDTPVRRSSHEADQSGSSSGAI